MVTIGNISTVEIANVGSVIGINIANIGSINRIKSFINTTNTAKSIVLDIATNHGDAGYTEFRQMDFYYQGAKLPLVETDYTAYGTAYSSNLGVKYAFDTTTSKIGSTSYQGWVHTGVTNTRCTVVFDTPITFDEIRINNGHHIGGNTTRGINDVVITISSDVITSTVYQAEITNPTVIYNGTFDIHVASNVEDEQILVLS